MKSMKNGFDVATIIAIGVSTYLVYLIGFGKGYYEGMKESSDSRKSKMNG